MSDPYWLTDEQMARLQPFFSESHGKPRVDDRRMLSGIVFVNRNGLRWCDAPSAYGPHKPVLSPSKGTGVASPPATTDARRFSSQPSRSPQPSSSGYDQ